MTDKEKVNWAINWLKEVKFVIDIDGKYDDSEAIEAVITDILGGEQD